MDASVTINHPEGADEELSAPDDQDDDDDDASIDTVKEDETDNPTSAVEDNTIDDSTSIEEEDDVDGSQSQAGEKSEPKPQPKPRSKHPRPYDPNKPPKTDADGAEVDRLFHALWQRQDKDWTLSHHRLSSLQHLCFRHQLSWGGTKTDLYERVQPVVRLAGHRTLRSHR